jgi:hypothetical protein
MAEDKTKELKMDDLENVAGGYTMVNAAFGRPSPIQEYTDNQNGKTVDDNWNNYPSYTDENVKKKKRYTGVS